jgi:ferredoxin
MKIKLDRTICDGFGFCAKHAPEYFSLDDWGYASLVGNGDIPEQDHDAVMRALWDCPVNAIMKIDEYRPSDEPTPVELGTFDEPAPEPEGEAEWFAR